MARSAATSPLKRSVNSKHRESHMRLRLHASVVAVPMLLSACDGMGHTTITTRSSVDGRDTVHVVTEVVKDVARFRCLASRSGLCRIVVFTRTCNLEVSIRDGAMDERCTTRALARLDVATGATRELRGMPAAIRQCASDVAAPALASCVQ
jgi:hypothetical protein